jgi:hypothetical protein
MLKFSPHKLVNIKGEASEQTHTTAHGQNANMKISILLLVTLVASMILVQGNSAHATAGDTAANLAGHWVSTSATITDLNGKKSACTKVEITMSSAPGQLTTQHYVASCPMMDTDWGPDPMIISGRNVMNSDQDQIGTFQDDTLVTSEDESGITYLFNLQAMPADATDQRHAKSLYGTQNDLGQIVIEADVVLQP